VIKETEAGLQKAALEYLNFQKDCFAIRINTQGVPLHDREGFRPSPMRGVSDLIVCIRGHFLAIELKVGRNKLSDDQQIFLENVGRTGGVAAECRSLEDIEMLVETIRKNTDLS